MGTSLSCIPIQNEFDRVKSYVNDLECLWSFEKDDLQNSMDDLANSLSHI
ncbi:MAG: hypothetical protein IJ599_00070 [Alphaproteobacteria bacterium]|nr:hypothetical protein [Alphaproteobacteria bacterium]